MEKFKTLKEKKDLYIEFSDDELKELGWKENQKLSMSITKDGGISIQPFVTVDIDTSTWPREVFKMLVELSLEQDKTVNDVIVDLIKSSLNIEDSKSTESQLICENGTI